MVRIGSRKWTAAHISQLVVLIDAGCSAACAAIALKRSISVVQKQGAAPRQTISYGRLAPVIFRGRATRTNEVMAMQTFFFDMKDGVPLRDRIGVEFDTNVEAIEHSRMLAQHFRDESLRDDQDLEISVVNALGREIHREFVHRETGGK
jgi:hypothetical protein